VQCASGSREGGGTKKESRQGGPRSTEMRPAETDQDQQYCCVTDEEARGEHCSPTPEHYKAKGSAAAPEDEDARANRRRAEKIQLYSEGGSEGRGGERERGGEGAGRGGRGARTCVRACVRARAV
jgi:hypothetical protein